VVSGPPQLIDTTDGRWTVSCTAVVTASTNPGPCWVRSRRR
jgi:hypothetical protein